MADSVNCSLLATRTDFNSYAKKLLDVTNDNLQLLDQCKVEVCGSLWGEGNGDISGIGVSDSRLEPKYRCFALLFSTEMSPDPLAR